MKGEGRELLQTSSEYDKLTLRDEARCNCVS